MGTQDQKNITSTPKMNLSLTALTVYTLLMSVLVEVAQAQIYTYTDSNYYNSVSNVVDGWADATDAAVKTGKRAATGIIVGCVIGGICCCALCAAGIYYMTKGNNPKQDA